MEDAVIDELIRISRSLFDRGYAFGTAGNLSVCVDEKVFVTPTGSSLGALAIARIAVADREGNVLGDCRPSKELPIHLAVYRARPEMKAVVHLHSTYATALCCLREVDREDALPVFTPYYAMRVPRLPVAPYFPPGDRRLAAEVESRIRTSPALLLENHGTLAAGKTLAEASALAEEIEEAARLFFLLGGRGRSLSAEQIAELRKRSS